MYRSLLVALVLIGATVASVDAQTVNWPAIKPGDRVRIESEVVSGVFILSEVQPESLVVQARSVSPNVRVPIASLERLEVGHGGRRGPTALKGGLIGGFTGGLLGTVVGTIDVNLVGNLFGSAGTGSPCYDTCSAGPMTHAALIGAGIGAGLGVLIGLSASDGGERWEDVPLQEQLSIAPSQDGGVAFGYERRF